jgi:hypothetical protein
LRGRADPFFWRGVSSGFSIIKNQVFYFENVLFTIPQPAIEPRCLFPADGFQEGMKDRSQKNCISVKENQILAFTGVKKNRSAYPMK